MNGWMDDAACAGEPLPTFFPSPGRYGYTRARELCATCPVIEQCRKFALANEQGDAESGRAGMFAGMTPIERVLADKSITREQRRRAYLSYINRNKNRR